MTDFQRDPSPMPGLIASLIEKARIHLWRRDQFTSAPLRAWFRERYRVDVGLYSYGCFDQWRMPGPIKIGRYCSISNSVRYADRTSVGEGKSVSVRVESGGG